MANGDDLLRQARLIDGRRTAADGGRIGLTLVTGFLGSGKTTLVRRLLARRGPERRVAVLVNEFSATPIDQDLLADGGGGVSVLAGGCACCATRGELVDALAALAASRGADAPDEVVVETSGLARPAVIAHALAIHPVLGRAYAP